MKLRPRRASARIAIAIISVTGVASAQPAPTPTPAPAPAPVPDPGPELPPELRPPPDEAEPAPPPTEEGTEEDLLAGLKQEVSTDTTFGTTLQLFGIETEWSGYGDVLLTAEPEHEKATFDLAHFVVILGVHVTPQVSAELELELEHGREVEIEYGFLDWKPTPSNVVILRAGKFLVPFGRFNEQLEASFRWNQISRPIVDASVIPTTWSEVGVQVRGTFERPGFALDYAAYVVNGLARGSMPEGGEEGEAEEEEEEAEGLLPSLRGNMLDNNLDKGIGGRTAATVNKGAFGATTLGVSLYSGKIDDNGAERLSLAAIDLLVKLGAFEVSGEAAQAWLGRKGDYLDRNAYGLYGQVAYTYEKLTFAGRYDYARFSEVEGEPTERHDAVAVSVKYAPSPTWNIRLEGGLPLEIEEEEAMPPPGEEEEEAAARILAMLAFVF